LGVEVKKLPLRPDYIRQLVKESEAANKAPMADQE
jgi:hypothetical protein